MQSLKNNIANGEIVGELIYLGNYSHEYDWLKANVSDYVPIKDEVFYHEQYFEMGSLCELSQKPRRAIAKVSCHLFI
jgi:hypothetical protein